MDDGINTLGKKLDALKEPNMSEDYRWRMLSDILREMCDAEGIELDHEDSKEEKKSDAKFCLLGNAIIGLIFGGVGMLTVIAIIHLVYLLTK